MKRIIYVYDKVQQKVVPREERQDKEKEHYHYVIPDEMNPLVHPCTGEVITSKSTFRRITKAHDCVEYGTEEIKDRRPDVADPVGCREAIIESMERHGKL